MTKEDKEILLKDLCARLPYGVKFPWNYAWDQETSVIEVLEEVDKDGYIDDAKIYSVEDIKPYLRPMSSMTEEESIELQTIINDWWDKELFTLTEEPMIEYALSVINYTLNPTLFDWLNKKHFDYRGLIPKGLAIPVTKENNPYKD